MSQLIIKDLNFCEQEFPRSEKIRGAASFFNTGFAFDFETLFSPAGAVATGFTFALGLTIGEKLGIIITDTFVIGSD